MGELDCDELAVWTGGDVFDLFSAVVVVVVVVIDLGGSLRFSFLDDEEGALLPC